MKAVLLVFAISLIYIHPALALEDISISTPSQLVLDDVYNLISDSINNIREYLSDMLQGLLDTILYWPKLIVQILVNIYNQITTAISSFISALMGLVQNLYSLSYACLSILLPSNLVQLVMVIFPIIASLRIYFLIRGSK